MQEDPAAELSAVSPLFARSWALFRERFWVLMLVTGIGSSAALLAVVAAALAALFLVPMFPGGLYAAIIAIMGGTFLAIMACVVWTQAAMLECILTPASPPWRECFRASAPKALGLAWVTFLMGAVVTGGMFLGVVPGVAAGVFLFFAPFIQYEEGLSGVGALLRSYQDVRGRWWPVMGRLAVAAGSAALPSTVPFAGAILGALLAPLPMVNAALVYRELKALRRAEPPLSGPGPKAVLAVMALGLLLPILAAVWLVPIALRVVPAMTAQISRNGLDPQAGQAMIDLLQGKGGLSSAAALYGAARAVEGGEDLGPAAAALDSPDPAARLEALAKLSRSSQAAVEVPLVHALLDGDAQMRPLARAALESRGVLLQAVPAVQARVLLLTADLESADPAVRAHAAAVLSDLGVKP